MGGIGRQPRPPPLLRPGSRRFDLVLSAGIAGGFAPVPIGDIASRRMSCPPTSAPRRRTASLPIATRPRQPTSWRSTRARRRAGRAHRGHSRHDPDRRHRHRHIDDGATSCGRAIRTRSLRRWRAPASQHAAALHGVRVRRNPRDQQSRRTARPVGVAHPRGTRRTGQAAGGRSGDTVGAGMKIAFSPCPNDTFVFHAWVHGMIEGAPPVDVTYADIDVTNTAAERGEYDLVKVSYAALPWLLDRYTLLPCGGALGRGCGPLVLTRERDARPERAHGRRAERALHGVPAHSGSGRPGSGRAASTSSRSRRSCRRVRDGTYDAGLVIHEARFTYPSYGLYRDRRPRRMVGSRHRPAHPARRDPRPPRLDAGRLDGVARASVEYAWAHPAASAAYVAEHADEMSPDVQRSTSPCTSTSSPAISATRAMPRQLRCWSGRSPPASRRLRRRCAERRPRSRSIRHGMRRESTSI